MNPITIARWIVQGVLDAIALLRDTDHDWDPPVPNRPTAAAMHYYGRPARQKRRRRAA